MVAVRIGLVGDPNPQVKAHTAIPQALELAARPAGIPVEPVWLPTSEPDSRFASVHAVWVVPGSPYANMEGALAAIRFAREQRRPFLGTCGGFQHALIEYARNVLGLQHADHAESNPAATTPLVTRLSCSLVGARGVLQFKEGSRLAAIYGRREAMEQYYCNFGLNPSFQATLQDGGLDFTAVDETGEARAVELPSHPFFIGTLFQPELSAFEGIVHPLIQAFVRQQDDAWAAIRNS